MRAQHVSPFAEAAIEVFASLLDLEAERGELNAKPQMFTTQQINVVCGITGALEGWVAYGMSIAVADQIASRLLGQTIVTFDQVAASAIGELGTAISERTVELLKAHALPCSISPPSILRGSNVKIAMADTPAVEIPLTIESIGTVEINVSLHDRRRQAA
jgi:chemotaxis protein CheX